MGLRDFIDLLEQKNLLIRIKTPVSTVLEITEIQNRLIHSKGPAVLFENVYSENGKIDIPVLANLFGTTERIAIALGYKDITELRELGKKLAFLKQPEPPTNFRDSFKFFPLIKDLLAMKPKVVKKGKCQEIVYLGEEIDLKRLPIQSCWPGEPAPLITWGMVVTKDIKQAGKKDPIYNAGIYRLQVLSHNKLIVRWLKHRGGAQQFRHWQSEQNQSNHSNTKMPIAIVIGCDPATLLSSVIPIPTTISEYDFSGLLRHKKLELVNCLSIPLMVPSDSEIVIEGLVDLNELADEGPYGDHTGFYNSVEKFPIVNITAITMRNKPLYLTTFTGKPPDEPSILGEALNEVFIPLLQQQFPEITDFWLPPEGCSYRIAVIAIKKSYPGHAKRVMMGIWSYLTQFTYTKFIIVVDHNVNIRSWPEVMWSVSTQMDFKRDLVLVENTPIDYLDFASFQPELGAKIGFDATTKIYPETLREWGKEIKMSAEIIDKVNAKWKEYGFD